ncbi:hypothetical protein MSAN_02223400 [Mycena sanguinolenta]|uniref:Uncharacterized protein n=1 Tax=Mycena sanguinolenta TaxID=230812 RepID=A0A8H6XBL8_9AGAR|nr:hypothetical protein MSAN_02223400 [Mycena sanguinolenta]
MEAGPFNRKITVVKVTEASPQRNYVSRSPSPYKDHAAAPSPTFRPKAKVNSSATSNLVTRKATSVVSSSAVSRTASVRSFASSSTARTATSLTPRSASPSKQSPSAPRPRAPITRGLTAKVGAQEARRGSLTSQTGYASPSIASSSPIPVSELLDLSDQEQGSPIHSPRITAKLSRRNSSDLPSSPPLPSASLRIQHRPRVPSVSSNASSSSSPFYPANAAPSAANPHRFPSARPSPPSSNVGKYYQPFPQDDTVPKYPRVNGFAKVDPSAIPLPPQSPPTSTVSFSSRSSHSPSSASYATESGTSQLSAARPGSSRDAADVKMRSGLESLMQLSDMLPTAEDGEDDSDDDYEEKREVSEDQLRASTFERKVRAEAKSVRKIADLEITNRSLLAINTSLEQTKHRQAKEIRELRRKLRESRLILPPRAFRAVKSQDQDGDAEDDDDDDDDDDDEDGEEDEAAEKEREAHDVRYRRCKVILEGLLETGRNALKTTPEDFPEPVKITKVLSAYEMPDADENDDDHPSEAKAPASPSHVAVPDSDDTGMSSEDEVEAMTLPRDSPPPSHPASPHRPATEIEPTPA